MKPVLVFLALSVVAFWVPWLPVEPNDPCQGVFPGWDDAPVPSAGPLRQIPLGARDARFAAGFPGRIAAFTDGTHTWVVRWLHQPTRKLHPAADCLRATGYHVQPAGIVAAADGTRWGTTRATHNQRTIRVRERIIGESGQGWTDVSAWFWGAALGRSRGPWWAVTEFGPEVAGPN